MDLLIRISDLLDRWITRVGRVAAWAGVALITITIFDVVTRRFFVLGSTKLQELEWHFHVVLFAFCIGFAYLKDAHVRIDLVRENLSERTQWWIELLGCLLFLLPYCALVVYFSFDFTVRSFNVDEVSASATGLTHRWIIKSAIPIGFSLLALSGLVVVVRKLIELFGPPDLGRKVHDVEAAEAEHIADVSIEKLGGSEGGPR
ncbi:MAG: TRAP transporter small permease subunit [Rhodospirillales bacterium]|nr:TRAP transporter small permease subunit [Rhodospirillales bacterium]MDH3919489.1 TRAP transporter small permease subunit [Rhodospirillales bacterium]